MNYVELKSLAYFGYIEYIMPNGVKVKRVISKNSKQDGYQNHKLLEKALRSHAAMVERHGNTITVCKVFQSQTLLDITNNYDLKP